VKGQGCFGPEASAVIKGKLILVWTTLDIPILAFRLLLLASVMPFILA